MGFFAYNKIEFPKQVLDKNQVCLTLLIKNMSWLS